MKKLKTTISEISALSLRRRYGPHYEEVLAEHLEEQDTSGRRQFAIVKPLPTKAEYEAMLRAAFTKPVEEWLGKAFDTFEDLRGEYEDWLNNMPDSLQDSPKSDELQETIDALEQIVDLDHPEHDWVEWLKVFRLPATDLDSRPRRLAEAISNLEDCAKELRRLVASGEYRKLGSPDADEDDPEMDEDALDPEELEAVANQLEEIAAQADELCLPGMF